MNQPAAQAIDELALFQRDRPAWVELAAPRIAARIAAMDAAQIDYCWATMLPDLRRAVWAHLDELQKDRVRAVRPIDSKPAARAA